MRSEKKGVIFFIKRKIIGQFQGALIDFVNRRFPITPCKYLISRIVSDFNMG